MSDAGEFHPRALSEPDVHVSAHPAPITQSTAQLPIANGQTILILVVQYDAASMSPDVGSCAVCISVVPIAPGSG